MILKLRLISVFIDSLVLLGTMILAYFVRVGFIFSTDFLFFPYLWIAFLSIIIWISSLIIFRAYSLNVRFTKPLHIFKIFLAGFTATSGFGLIFYFTQRAFFSRLLLLYIILFGTIGIIIVHIFMQWIEYILIQHGYGNIRLLIIGSHRGVCLFIKDLKKNISPFVPVAILDGYGTSQKEIAGVPVLGKLNILEDVIQQYAIDGIVQADNIEQVINIVHFCQKNKLDYYLLPYLFGMVEDKLTIRYLEKPLITINNPKSSCFFSHLFG